MSESPKQPPIARSKSQLRRFDALGATEFTCEFCGTARDIVSVLRPEVAAAALRLRGLPPEWDDACAYALRIVPEGVKEGDDLAAMRYMEVRNAYLMGCRSKR